MRDPERRDGPGVAWTRWPAVLMVVGLQACGGATKPAVGTATNGSGSASEARPADGTSAVTDAQAKACWKGQRYSVAEGRCTRKATRCPEDRVLRSGSCWLRSAATKIAIGDRVRRGPDWESGDTDEGGLGTVVAMQGRQSVQVQWELGDSQRYRWGEDGNYDLEVVDDPPAFELAEHYRVVAGPSCRKCPGGAGGEARGVVDMMLEGNRVRVNWDDGTSSESPVGVSGVLPAGGPYYPLVVGDRVGRGAAWASGSSGGRGPGTVTRHEPDEEYAEVRWDDGTSSRYRWGAPDESELVLLDNPPDLKIAKGWRVIGGPSCGLCASGETGEATSVTAEGDIEVTWISGKTGTFGAGVDGVLPVGPPLPKLPAGSRVIRGAAWSGGEQDKGGKGTVTRATPDGYVWVQWDEGRSYRYRWGDGGVFEVALVAGDGMPKLKVGDFVVAGPTCPGCPSETQGVVEKIKGKKVRVRWDAGASVDLPVGLAGVLKSGELPSVLHVGDRVVRGPDWQWGDQGGNTTGTVTSAGPGQTWVQVAWDNGENNAYRWGAPEGGGILAYDLDVVEHAHP